MDPEVDLDLEEAFASHDSIDANPQVKQTQVSGFGCRVSGFGFRVPGSGFRVLGFGFRSAPGHGQW